MRNYEIKAIRQDGLTYTTYGSGDNAIAALETALEYNYELAPPSETMKYIVTNTSNNVSFHFTVTFP